jgi:protein SCO1/2
MPRNINITLAIALAITAITPLSVRQASAADTGSPWGANYFPNVPLVTQEGKTVRFYDDLLKNKTVVINFIYTKCSDSCPLETAKLAHVQRMLGDRVGRDIFFYSISIDPERDTPEQLKEYAAKYHVGPGWVFLTGDEKDIEQVRKKLGQAAHPGENSLTGHSTSLTLGNEASGQWMQESSMDDSNYIAGLIGDRLSSWNHPTPGISYSEEHMVHADKGAYLFRSRCAACHTVGGGDTLGPDLVGVSSVRNSKWLTNFIEAPDRMVAERDPIAIALYNKYKQMQMPNLRLGDSDVAALIAYLDAQSRDLKAPAAKNPAEKRHAK